MGSAAKRMWIKVWSLTATDNLTLIVYVCCSAGCSAERAEVICCCVDRTVRRGSKGVKLTGRCGAGPDDLPVTVKRPCKGSSFAEVPEIVHGIPRLSRSA